MRVTVPPMTGETAVARVLEYAEWRDRRDQIVREMLSVDMRLDRFRRIAKLGDALPVQLNSPEELCRRDAFHAKYRMLPPDVRQAIHEQCGGKCGACATVWRPTVDHIVPLALGGANDDGNLWTLCASCNTDKGQLTRTSWAGRRLTWLRQRRRELKAQFSELNRKLDPAE